MSEKNACTGQCCQRFTMPVSMEERAKSIAAEEAGQTHWIDCNGLVRGLYKDEHVSTRFIQDMLIPLGLNEDGHQHYTCKNYDKENNLCTVYENRPGLCRRYPNEDKRCEYDDNCIFMNLSELIAKQENPTT